MTRRTKIVATIGPASQEPAIIEQLINAGVNVFRLNFSHGSAEQHRKNVTNIRNTADRLDANIAILGDLQGPKIRIGDLLEEPLALTIDQQITLSIDESKKTKTDCVHVQYKPLPQSVEAGDTLLIDDGLIRLQVLEVDGDDVRCKVTQAGKLKSRKGLNRLGGGLSAAAITEKDHRDVELAVELKLDYLAVSFPSSAQDLLPVKQQLAKLDAHIPLISKIERAEAVASDDVLTDLILASDGVMVARGDLGVELGDAKLVGMQKKIIKMARRNDRPVITATQMMESMINSPVPTRAEVFDVANAVLDGTDAVMLSAETASGNFPAKVVAAMSDTCLGAEQQREIRTSSYRIDREFSHVDDTIALSAMYAANHLKNIKALICLTESGRTALIMSRLSSGLPIYAISRHKTTCNRMALYRGVIPIYRDVTESAESAYEAALKIVAEYGQLKRGSRVTITCGDISGTGGGTNTLKILEVE